MGINGDDMSDMATTDSTVVPGISQNMQVTEQPVFDIEQVHLQFGLNHSLHKLHVKNNIMYLILEKHAYKINLDNPSEVKQLPMPVSLDNNIVDSWLHPNGWHLMIKTKNNNYYYLHESYESFKVLPRFKNMDVQFVVFPNSQEYKQSTGDFLISTKEGSVYIGNIKHHESLQDTKKDDKYVKLVYKQSLAISGLTFSNNDLQINLFSNNQLMIWDCFDNSYDELIKVFKVAPKIVNLPKPNNAGPVFESNGNQFVYLVPPKNIIHSNDLEVCLSKAEKLNFMNDSISTYHNSLIITPHHLIALNLHHDKLYIHNKLANAKPTIVDVKTHLKANEKMLGITADYTASTYWLYSSNNIYELVISNESSSVWYNYYRLGKYEEALKCLESPDSSNLYKKDMILVKQGYDYLQKGGFGIEFTDEDIDKELFNLQVKGVKILGRSSEPFEKVCLMLLNLQQPLTSDSRAKRNYLSEKLLVEYLLVKFHTAKKNKVRIRVVILSSWIVELMLRTIYSLENEILMQSSELPLNQNDNLNKTTIDLKRNILVSLNNQFESFLAQNFSILDAKTIYQIIGDLHYPSKLIYFAELIKDYKFILNYYINTEDWDNAFKTLINICTAPEPNVDMVYKVSTILLLNSPKLTIETWLKLPGLEYEKLLPAILIHNKNSQNIPLKDNQSIKFLLKAIYDKGTNSKIMNDYYLSLLITYPYEDEQSKALGTRNIVRFLNYAKLEATNSTKKTTLYSPDSILRLCINYKQYQAAIIILMNDFGLFEQALELSLANSLTELAEFVLKKHEEFISNSNDLEEIGKEYEFKYNKNDTEDINSISKIKLEEESYSSRKKLMMMFARYIIEGVCQGKEFSILEVVNEENYADDLVSANTTEKQNGDTVMEVTRNMIDSMSLQSLKDELITNKMSLTKLNRAIKYLLNLSYGCNSNSNVITLKDLLPLFPESIMVNNFKDEIVRSLNQYNSRINQLSSEMQESLTITHKLKSQIKESRTKEAQGKIYTIIEPGEPCQLCNNLLVNKNFLCFPNCHHNFHKDCLMKYYLKLKGDYRFKKIFQNFKKNATVSNRHELDEMLLKECVLCNEGNINNIDSNLIDAEKNKSEIQEWAL